MTLAQAGAANPRLSLLRRRRAHWPPEAQEVQSVVAFCDRRLDARTATLLLGKSKCALARLIVHQQQIVTLPESALRLTGFSLASCFGTHHQRTTPAVVSRIPHRAKETLPSSGVIRGSIHLKCWLQSKSLRILKPCRVVLESDALCPVARTTRFPFPTPSCGIEGQG
jgi:hypothetical protein